MAMTFLRESIGILRNVVFKNVRLSSSNVAPVDPHEGKVCMYFIFFFLNTSKSFFVLQKTRIVFGLNQSIHYI